jgi:hypothetical protein
MQDLIFASAKLFKEKPSGQYLFNTTSNHRQHFANTSFPNADGMDKRGSLALRVTAATKQEKALPKKQRFIFKEAKARDCPKHLGAGRWRAVHGRHHRRFHDHGGFRTNRFATGCCQNVFAPGGERLHPAATRVQL